MQLVKLSDEIYPNLSIYERKYADVKVLNEDGDVFDIVEAVWDKENDCFFLNVILSEEEEDEEEENEEEDEDD